MNNAGFAHTTQIYSNNIIGVRGTEKKLESQFINAKIMKAKATKRVFKKITTVTFFEIFEITKDFKFRPYENERGERVKFKKRASAERFCEKHKLCYVEMKHIFYR